MKMFVDTVKFLFASSNARVQIIKNSVGGSVILNFVGAALFESTKSIWIKVVFCILATVLAFAIVTLVAHVIKTLSDKLKNRIYGSLFILESATIVFLFAYYLVSRCLANVPYDVYHENVVDSYGMYFGTGKSDSKPHAGWYRFRYKGIHREGDIQKHRYPVNREEHFGIWFRTLHSVDIVDNEGRTLPDFSCAVSGQLIYKYRDDGLDVEIRERSVLDSTFSDDMPLYRTMKWYDAGDAINAECKIYDSRNRRVFAPSHTTSAKGQFGDAGLMPMSLHSKFSSYRVLRDDKGRVVSIFTAVPDHDGINGINIEYADNDEHEMSYWSKVTYNASNSDGVSQTTVEYNGCDIAVHRIGDIRHDIYFKSLDRNCDLWTNALYVVQGGSINKTLTGVSKRTLDAHGRLTKEEAFLRIDGSDVSLGSVSYCWSLTNNISVVESVEYRDGENKLRREPFLLLADVVQFADTNMISAAKIRFHRADGACDAILMDETGSNILSRVRFVTKKGAESFERIEWCRNNGKGVSPLGLWRGRYVVAFERVESKVTSKSLNIPGAEHLVCNERRWLDADGMLVSCPAGWAACREYFNEDFIEDVESPGFSGMLRRIEYIDEEGAICRNAGVPSIQEFDYDRSGRLVEMLCRDADNRLMDALALSTNSIPIAAVTRTEYDKIGRICRLLYFDSNNKPCSQPGLYSERILCYSGESRNPMEEVLILANGTALTNAIEAARSPFAYLSFPSFDGLHYLQVAEPQVSTD